MVFKAMGYQGQGWTGQGHWYVNPPATIPPPLCCWSLRPKQALAFSLACHNSMPNEVTITSRAIGRYQCPNGHPYIITECGGATERSRCPECGAVIGGEMHRLDSSNRVHNMNA